MSRAGKAGKPLPALAGEASVLVRSPRAWRGGHQKQQFAVAILLMGR